MGMRLETVGLPTPKNPVRIHTASVIESPDEFPAQVWQQEET
jgi:hypothetical protein